MAKKKAAGFDLKPVMLVIGIILVPVSILLIYRVGNSSERLIPIGVVAVIVGAILESYRLLRKIKPVILSALGSFILSFFIFLPGKHESVYNLDNHLISWPYCFLFIFLIFSMVMNKDKLIPRLTEGITLVQSIAILYWAIDYGFFSSSTFVVKILLIIGILFSVVSIINAFTNIRLTKGMRLTLSIWSSIIMIAFAIDYIISVYKNGQVENAFLLNDKIYIFISYFLLGISSVYILQNTFLVIGYLPGKQEFFNKEYFARINELTSDHLKRYSDSQMGILLASLCFILVSIIFFINYSLKFIPTNTAIWAIFFVFNTIIYYADQIKNYRQQQV
jgi:hypothetical protein